MRAKTDISERLACRLVGVSRSVLHYESSVEEDGLQERLVELSGERRRFGYRRLHILVERAALGVECSDALHPLPPSGSSAKHVAMSTCEKVCNRRSVDVSMPRLRHRSSTSAMGR
jgi:hypothetical protein